jgi:hypothetical protein
LFYDVGKVTDAEASKVASSLAREGSILVVPPTGAGELVHCPTLHDFAANGGAEVRVLAVAGVGSSALGSAAFARNVADALGAPVAAVVSGYGLADLVTEAAGGWFWFGTLNRLRRDFEILDDLGRRLTTRNHCDLTGPSQASAGTGVSLGRMSLDTRTVMALLSDKRFQFKLLTGHSKGNLVLSEALYELDEKSIKSNMVPASTWLVKFSAAVSMPPRFAKSIDVMGSIDWFGTLNSLPSEKVEVECPLSWHHTNTELPFRLPVTRTLTEICTRHGVAV